MKWICLVLVLVCAGMLAAPVASAQSQQKPANTGVWPAGSDQYTFQMIGNAHIDAVWLWPWHEAMSVVLSTFHSALDRMNEDPDVTMTTSSSQFYEWVAQTDPDMLAQIKKRVQEGRWDVVNGWWVEPDVNIPNGEALARQGLYGQEVLQQYFGKTATVGYNPDSFGHTGNLPQILKLEGMNDYVFMRPGVQEKSIPEHLFWWQGVDGTRALTFRILFSYADGSNSVEPLTKRSIAELSTQHDRDVMGFFGLGDHGGGPTKLNMASIKQVQTEPGAPKMIYSTPDRYFAEMRARIDSLTVPVVDDDLQHHSVGCYTAVASIKKENRESEATLAEGEKISEVASVAWGGHYPKHDFTEAWKRVLFLQFHDDLAGTALPEQYKWATDAEGRAVDVAQQAIDINTERLAWQVPTTDPDSTYLFVFNPHAWATTQDIEYDLSMREGTPTSVTDYAGNAIPFQWTQATTTAGRQRLVAEVKLPPFGYQQIRITRTAPAAAPASPIKADDHSIENEHLKVTFAADGTMAIFDKDANHDVFKSGTGARAIVYDDPNDTWAHNWVAYKDELGQFKLTSTKLLESGPLRAVLRVHSAWGNSTLTTDWILYAGSRNLQSRVSLDWHEHMKMLKFSYPVDVQNPKSTYEIAYGAIVKATDNEENPGQRWIDVDGDHAGSTYGLAVINNAKYGYSVDGSDERISIARGAVFANHMPAKILPEKDYIWQDQGVQTFEVTLVPHAGVWQDTNIVHQAEEMMAPPVIIYQGIHPGSRPLTDSFLSVDAPDVVISAIKQAEDGDDTIVRLYETAGRESTAHVDLKFANAKWTGTFHPFEIKTIRINAKTSAISEVNILEQ
jgi:alpha-mannosidase